MTINETAEIQRQKQFSNQCWNAVVNHPRIREQFRIDRPCVSTLPRVQGIPVVILGSGASLDDLIPRMDEWRGAVFCSPSQLSALGAHGIVPDAIFVDDTNRDAARDIADFAANSWTLMITHPCVDPAILDAWKGMVRYFIEFYENELDKLMIAMYPFIRFRVGAQVTVVNLMVQMAHMLGYSPVIIAGVDLSSVDGQARATQYKKNGQYFYKELPKEMGELPDADKVAFDIENLIMMCLWKIYGINLVSVSRGIVDCPRMSIDQMMAGQFPKPMKPQDINAHVDSITVPRGIYASVADGQSFIEFAERMQASDKPDFVRRGKLWTKTDDVWDRKR